MQIRYSDCCGLMLALVVVVLMLAGVPVGVQGQNPPPPYFYELGTFHPQGPNATCMTASEVSARWPTDWADCRRVVSDQYSSYYVDANQDRRNLLMQLLYIYSAPSSRECQEISFTISCLLRFRPCANVSYSAVDGLSSGGSVIAAVPVCRQICDIWSEKCGFGGDAQAQYILFNCTIPAPILWDNWTIPMFPTRNETLQPITVQNGTITATLDLNLPCFTSANLSYFTPPQVCPSPLLPDPDTGLCSLGCPLPVIDDDEYKALEVMMSVFGWISFVLTAFLIASYLIDKTKRSYPAILPLFFIFCINATSFAFCLGNMVGHEDVWCKNDAQPYDFGGGACTVQGIIWVYFTMAGVFWWLVIALNLLVMLVWKKYKDLMKRWYHLYHLVWLLPIITLIISLANEKLGYGGDVWCSVHIGPPSVSYFQTREGVQTDQDDTAYLWNLLLIIVPVFCLVFVGMIALIAVFIYMAFNFKSLGFKYLLAQWRLVIFLMFYIYIYVFVFAFQIELIVQKDDQYNAYADYIECLLLGLFNPNLNCSLTQYVNFPLWVIVVFNASAQGIGVFIIFGTTAQVYKAWLRLFRLDKFLKTSSTSGGSSMTKIHGTKVTGTSGQSSHGNSEMMNSIDSDSDKSSSDDEGENEKEESKEESSSEVESKEEVNSSSDD